MKQPLTYIPVQTANRIEELFCSLAKDYLQRVYDVEEEICSFGVYTDSDISNFFFGYNTNEKRKAAHDSPSSVDHEIWSIEDDIWSIPEWKNNVDDSFQYDPREIELFGIFDTLIRSTHSDSQFPNYKSDAFYLLCHSLKVLKDEKVFSNISTDFLLLVQEQDNGLYDTRQDSLSLVLTPKQLEAYLQYT
jgi:hypothetical protein